MNRMHDRLLEQHRQILEARGIDGETAEHFGVRSIEPSAAGEEWIAIPYLVNGEVVNWKRRTIAGPKKFFQTAESEGGRKCWWNYDVLFDQSLARMPLVITEGEMDAMIAYQCGHMRVISAPDGAPAQQVGEDKESRKYTYVSESLSLLDSENFPVIILATDSDGPGVNLMNDLAIRLGRHRCKFVRYPKDCKDLNDAFKAYGHAGVTQSLLRAQWCRVDGIYRMGELPPVADRQIFYLGMHKLDDHFRVRPMDFTVVTGIPGQGKTSLLTDIACRMVTQHGWTVAFASFEQQPQIDHRRNLRTYFNRKKVIYQTEEEREAADAWIDQNFSFIVPNDEDEVTLSWTLERAAASVVQHGSKMIIVDPWNEMDHVKPDPTMSLTEYTSFAIKEFKRFARKYQCHVVVCAHPTKQRKLDDGTYGIPTLYDISDSAAWANKADAGIVVWRGAVKGVPKTIIRVAKSRYHDQIGVPGEVEASFDPNNNRFNVLEMSEDEKSAQLSMDGGDR